MTKPERKLAHAMYQLSTKLLILSLLVLGGCTWTKQKEIDGCEYIITVYGSGSQGELP